MLYLIGGGIGLKNKPRILSHLLSISTGSKVCVIVTASGDPEKIGGLYKRAFFSLGADNCAILNPRSKCDASSVPDALHDCDIIFFSGGDQLVLSNALRGTAMWQKIADHFEAGHMIAGTSAGAAAMSLRMIYGPDDWTVGKPEDSVSLEAGLGLMPNLVIDTHFSERHRLLRLQKILPSGFTGIGIDEKTAAIIDEDKLTAFGQGHVFILKDGRTMTMNPGDIFSEFTESF